jgi:hypothetical protein
MTERPRPDMEEPVSLAPLDPEEALRAILAVRPPEEPNDSEDEKGES